MRDMKGKTGFRYCCYLSGIFFLLAPLCLTLGLAVVGFPDGQEASLCGFKLFFGGDEPYENGGFTYVFTYRLNPLLIFVLCVSFIASVGSFFGFDFRRNLLFSAIAGLVEIVGLSLSLFFFSYINPGFPLESLKGGFGYVLSLALSAFALIALFFAYASSQKAKKRAKKA